MDDPKDPKKLYRRWLFELWRGDFPVAPEILAPEFLGHWPQFDVDGPLAAAEQIRRSHEYFSDIDTTLDVGPLVEGELLAAHWTFHGSYRQGVPGATVSPGTRISFSGQDIFRYVDGMFTEYWVVSDALGMLTQLGVLGGD